MKNIILVFLLMSLLCTGCGCYEETATETEAEIVTEAETLFEENEEKSSLYTKTEEYLKEEFERVYTPYYDIQSLEISSWNERANYATFFYKMTYLYYNRDPDTVEYIKEAKENGSSYEVLYEDYLALKESNYDFKVILNGGELELYSNQSPVGEKWERIAVDDFILGGS